MNLITIYTCALLYLAPADKITHLKSKADTSYIDTAKYVLLPFDKTRDYKKFMTLETGSKSAPLYATEIRKIEEIIRKKVKELKDTAIRSSRLQVVKGNKSDPMLTYHIINNPGKYYKQLITVINLKGQKEVWVNCLCRINDTSWKKDVVIVEDGGNCYFQLKINLTTGVVSEFFINGVA
jgi:hypothetical protein